jgi:hypothetical protein
MIKNFINDLKIRYYLWKDSRQTKIKGTLVPPAITKQVTHEAYYQGIAKIRKKVQQLIAAPTKEEYERVLKDLTELQNLAIKNDSAEYIKFIETLKSAYVYKGQDVKSDKDKILMVDKRIKHFDELRRHKEFREKARQERKKQNEPTN